jgi:hypothetical protein
MVLNMLTPQRPNARTATVPLSTLRPGAKFHLSRPSCPSVYIPGMVLSVKPPTQTRLRDGTAQSDCSLVTVRVDMGKLMADGVTQDRRTVVWSGDTQVKLAV